MDLRPPPTRSGDPAHHVSIIALLAMQLSTLLGLGTLLWLAWPGHRPSAYPSAARQREVASKLKAAGALDEAANLYEQHLATTADLENGREQLAFSLGTLYLEGGQYERALRWFYEAEAVGGQLEQEIA